MKRNKALGFDYPPPADDTDNPLIKKLLDILHKLQEKNRERD